MSISHLKPYSDLLSAVEMQLQQPIEAAEKFYAAFSTSVRSLAQSEKEGTALSKEELQKQVQLYATAQKMHEKFDSILLLIDHAESAADIDNVLDANSISIVKCYKDVYGETIENENEELYRNFDQFRSGFHKRVTTILKKFSLQMNEARKLLNGVLYRERTKTQSLCERVWHWCKETNDLDVFIEAMDKRHQA